MGLTISMSQKLAKVAGRTLHGNELQSPGGESRRDCTYQEAPSLTVICNAEPQCMLFANLETMRTLKNRWLSSLPSTPPPQPPPVLSGVLQHCARLRKAEEDNNISVSTSHTLITTLAYLDS